MIFICKITVIKFKYTLFDDFKLKQTIFKIYKYINFVIIYKEQ